jgi:hypothetical protein
MEAYDTSSHLIEYNSNIEYRKILRNLFRMDTEEILKDLESKYNTKVLDEETMDELLYDSDKISDTLRQLYELTKENLLFQNLYTLAAAKMISTDLSIGQIILFSYDYLYLFHPCMCVFLVSPEEFNESCTYYLQLKDKLEKR